MKLIKKSSLLTIAILLSVLNSFAGNPVDSDLSNRAGTNSGNSHLDIYIFIVALLVLVVIVPFFEKRSKSSSTENI